MAEMADAINAGHVAALEKRSARNTTPTSFETWVKQEFAPRFLGKQRVRVVIFGRTMSVAERAFDCGRYSVAEPGGSYDFGMLLEQFSVSCQR